MRDAACRSPATFDRGARVNGMDGLIETLLLSVAGTLLLSLVASLVGPVWRAREHCRCTAPTPAADGPRCSTCGLPFDVTTGDRPND